MTPENSQTIQEQAHQQFRFGEMASRAGKFAQAQKFYQASLSLYRQIAAKRSIAWTLIRLAEVTRHIGSDTELSPFEPIAQIRSEALPLLRQEQDYSGIATCLRLLSTLSSPEEAQQMLQESLTLTTTVGDTEGRAWSLFLLGQIASRTGDRAKAAQLQQQGRTLLQEKKHKRSLASMKLHDGLRAFCEHDYDHALILYQEALAFYREVNEHRGIAQTLMAQEAFSERSLPSDQRVTLLTEAARCSQKAGIPAWEAGCYSKLIEIAQKQGDEATVAVLRKESTHLEAEMKEDAALREEMSTLEKRLNTLEASDQKQGL